MWLKLNEKHTKFAEIIKKWLSNSDLYWCCIYCDEKIIQHKSVNCVTVEHIYVNPYILDKVFYDFRAKILRIRCPDCRSLLDDGNVNSLMKLNKNSVYFNETTTPIDFDIN